MLIPIRVWKKKYNELSDCDNESLYMPTVPTLFEKSDIPMTADEMMLTIFLKYHTIR